MTAIPKQALRGTIRPSFAQRKMQADDRCAEKTPQIAAL
jgi:hypothetical protein